MVETRNLAYKDRFVRYLIQTLSDRFDTLTDFQSLPFVDQTSRIPLVYRVNQTEFTQIYSAIMTGGDLAFPDIAHELELIWANPDDYGVSEDFCLDFETADSTMINYFPMNPFTEPEEVPDGYLMPPFWVFGDVLPEFIGGWFDDLLEEITGYEPTDVLSTIGSFPIFGDWDDLISGALPRFDITVDGKGILELHLLSVPFGGRALITIDTIPDIVDIVAGLWLESDWLVDLDRDYTSIPPESLEVMIVEFPVETTGLHTVYVTMLPVVNDSLVPLSFGGGIRKITWCPDEVPDEECPECPEPETIPEMLEDEEFFETEYLPPVFGEFYSETVANEAAQAIVYDSTPQSIAPLAPTSTPDALEKNALCAAINRFVSLYASTKLCLIQSKNFVEILWTKLAGAANDFYDVASNLMSPIYSPNIYSCFVSDATAITALQDEAAIEELACFIYDELKTVTMSQANFDNAVSDAATTLTGNAQDIACLMTNDNSLSVYINMLESYNVQLNKQAASEQVDCPCETDTYWMLINDFATGKHGWKAEKNAAETALVGLYSGTDWRNSSANPPNSANTYINRNFDLEYVIKAFAIEMTCDGFTGVGQDAVGARGWQYEETTGAERFTGSSSFLTTNGTTIREYADAAETLASLSYRVRIENAGAPTGSNYTRINRIALYGLPNGTNKPPGSVWVSALPTTGNYFP